MNREIISAQKARTLVGDFGWRFVRRGFEWFSNDMCWIVYQVDTAGGMYARRPCSPRW